MLVQSHDTASRIEPQALPLLEDAWTTEVIPRLPANLAAQAGVLKAFPRVRGLATPYDLSHSTQFSGGVFQPLTESLLR